MRNTKQKKLIFDIVENNYCHMTASEIHKKACLDISNISLGTVYRILNDLVEHHKIVRIKTKSGINHYDHLTDNNHYHFICDKCQKIIDIFDIDLIINDKQLSKLCINSVDVTLTGLCDDCL